MEAIKARRIQTTGWLKLIDNLYNKLSPNGKQYDRYYTFAFDNYQRIKQNGELSTMIP